LYADLDSVDPGRIADVLAGMEADGLRFLDDANVPAPQRALLRLADVRYRRQAYELTVPIADGPITSATLDALAASFHSKHEQTYGHANRAEPVQLVNLRLTALGRLPGLTLTQRSDATLARQHNRDVWFAESGFIATPVHWRNGLIPGTTIAGPAIIEALDSTTVVPPGWRAGIDERGYMKLSRTQSHRHGRA
jgi:N-methylhydantoinase A